MTKAAACAAVHCSGVMVGTEGINDAASSQEMGPTPGTGNSASRFPGWLPSAHKEEQPCPWMVDGSSARTTTEAIFIIMVKTHTCDEMSLILKNVRVGRQTAIFSKIFRNSEGSAEVILVYVSEVL